MTGTDLCVNKPVTVPVTFEPLCICRTAPLTTRCYILYIIQQIYVQNILNMLHTLRFFFSSKCRLFHNSTFFGSCVIHIIYTDVLKLKKKIRRQRVILPSTPSSSKCSHSLTSPHQSPERTCLASSLHVKTAHITTNRGVCRRTSVVQLAKLFPVFHTI